MGLEPKLPINKAQQLSFFTVFLQSTRSAIQGHFVSLPSQASNSVQFRAYNANKLAPAINKLIHDDAVVVLAAQCGQLHASQAIDLLLRRIIY